MSFAGHDWRRQAAAFLSGETETFGTVLVGIILKAYGAAALNWDPLTLRVQIGEDFGAEVARVPYSKMMALINVMTTDTVYNSVPVFDTTVNSLAGSPGNQMDGVPGADDVAWAVAEITMADPDAPKDRGRQTLWSPDIAGYVGMVLDHEGISGEPKVLAWARRRGQKVASDHTQDPDFYNAAMGPSQAKATEIDEVVNSRVQELVQHLGMLGIKPAELG
jgi:hypothetical protein